MRPVNKNGRMSDTNRTMCMPAKNWINKYNLKYTISTSGEEMIGGQIIHSKMDNVMPQITDNTLDVKLGFVIPL